MTEAGSGEGLAGYERYHLGSASLASVQREEPPHVSFEYGTGASSAARKVVILIQRPQLERIHLATRDVPAHRKALSVAVRDARAALEAEPLDDLEAHPVDEMLRSLVGEHGGAAVAAAIEAALASGGDDESRAGLVQSLGRVEPASVLPWGIAAARAALGDASVRVRGAALKALERWRSPEITALLQKHLPRETEPWLAETIRKLLKTR